MITLSVPMAVPDLSPVVVLVLERAIDDTVRIPETVTVALAEAEFVPFVHATV